MMIAIRVWMVCVPGPFAFGSMKLSVSVPGTPNNCVMYAVPKLMVTLHAVSPPSLWLVLYIGLVVVLMGVCGPEMDSEFITPFSSLLSL